MTIISVWCYDSQAIEQTFYFIPRLSPFGDISAGPQPRSSAHADKKMPRLKPQSQTSGALVIGRGGARKRADGLLQNKRPKQSRLCSDEEEGGFAFLRKSHAGCGVPPALRQEPAFESTRAIRKTATPDEAFTRRHSRRAYAKNVPPAHFLNAAGIRPPTA